MLINIFTQYSEQITNKMMKKMCNILINDKTYALSIKFFTLMLYLSTNNCDAWNN